MTSYFLLTLITPIGGLLIGAFLLFWTRAERQR